MCEHEALAHAAAHACAGWPLETCGAVVRDEGGLRFVAVRNAAPDSRTAFAFAASEQLALWRAEAEGRFAIVAIVHSHPDGSAEFSQQDRRLAVAGDGSALVPGVEHWVLAVHGPAPRLHEAKAWTWRPDGWSGRALAPPYATGCASCIRAQNRL